MNNLKSPGDRRTFKTLFSFYTDVIDDVFTFKRGHLLLERQHLSVKFTADLLIRRGIISSWIMRLPIIFARITQPIQRPRYQKRQFIQSCG